MYQPKRLTLWTYPASYAGQTWYDYFGTGQGRSRDSDALERANFQATLNALGFKGEETPDDCPTINDEPTRVIVRENHWACGWVEWIAIHKSDDKGLKIADEIAENLENYPVIDEELYSEIEDEDCNETWQNCFDPKERLQYLREHTYIKTGIFRQLREACRGDWYEAANLLPSPSDILA